MELKKNKMEHQILKPFGPSIIKIKIPQDTIDQINLFVDEIVNNKDKLEKFNEGSKLAGNVYQEFLMDIDFMKKIKWGEFLGQASNHWIWEEKKSQLKSFQIIKSWIVRQFKNEYNPIHFHSGHISGVGYLKVPNTMGTTFQKEKKINYNGKLVLIDGSKKLFCSPTYIITPKVGDLYLFPSYLMHTVYPFSETDEERRSVSFNAKIDDQSSSL
jgi:hypothetical protein|tara:strand:+ start:46 stop:687 length:642 start_codon:yes stop_codon:yes gene_type:complete